MSLAKKLIEQFTAESAKTRLLLAAVPEDKYDWKPHEKSWTVGQLASHLAESPSWHQSMLIEVFDFDAMMADYKPFVAKDKAELLATFDANNAALSEAIEGQDDDFMNAVWKGISGGREIMSGKRDAEMQELFISHQIHHRGQLSVYLRLLDVTVPQTYGPTADLPDWS